MEFKRKRRARKEQRSSKTKQLEMRDGPQYETGLGYCNASAVEEIPPYVKPPDLERVSSPDIHSKIVFDLETSSRGSSAWDLLVQNTSNVVCSQWQIQRSGRKGGLSIRKKHTFFDLSELSSQNATFIPPPCLGEGLNPPLVMSAVFLALGREDN